MNEWLRRLAQWGRLRFTSKQISTARPVKDLVADILGNYGTTVLNVGARWGDAKAWWNIDPVASCVGFEPDADECARLNVASPSSRRERYLPIALGAETGEATLYVTQEAACSSLYPPDETLATRFPDLKVIRSATSRQVPITTLDEWWNSEEKPRVSFLKLDTQGSELDILRGGRKMLKDCLGCEVEVEFSPIYQGQPLFADVDSFLRSQGFVLWQLRDACHYSEQPERGKTGRLYWANAVYLRDYRAMENLEENWARTMILAVLLEALGDEPAARSCLRIALSGLGQPVETGKAPTHLVFSENSI